MEEEIIDPEREEESGASADTETKSGISADLIRGHINTIILRTLYERDKYGYEIIEEIEAKSRGQYTLKQPTLYSALKRLESQGYINAYWRTDEVSQGGRRKYYTLTDSGREITERNQAEWEYSRTVIDNLISDRSFDFTQPPPAAVDFKILKNSTSRVPVVKDDDDEVLVREVTYEEPSQEQVVEIKREDATEVIITESPAPVPEEHPAPVEVQQEVLVQPQEQPQPEHVVVEQVSEEQTAVVDEAPAMSDEERKIVHENYLRLISEPVEERHEETPYAESMDTERLIYNNRPEAERDYRNLVNNLFVNANSYRHESTPQPVYAEPEPTPAPTQPQPKPQPVVVSNVKVSDASGTGVKSTDATSKAKNDGLTVGTSEYSVTGTRRRRYNRGTTMFWCALIVGVIMLLEFALCLIFQKDLGVTIAYPLVILALACAEVLIFGVLCYTDIGKSSRKPTTTSYLTACIVVGIIAVAIAIVVALILNVNFTAVGDIMAKIVIPCIVALNIPLFGVLFYLLSK